MAQRTAGAFSAVGQGLKKGWTALATGVGKGVRTISRAGEIDAGHARDGWALFCLALGIILSVMLWAPMSVPIGGYVLGGLSYVVGTAVHLLPILLFAAAFLLMLTPPIKEECRVPIALGGTLLSWSVLGIWHIASGRPQNVQEVQDGAGVIGFITGEPLVRGLTSPLAVIIFLLVAVFSLLLLTNRRIQDVGAYLRTSWITIRGWIAAQRAEASIIPPDDEDEAEDTELQPAYLSRSPEENYPTESETSELALMRQQWRERIANYDEDDAADTPTVEDNSTVAHVDDDDDELVMKCHLALE